MSGTRLLIAAFRCGVAAVLVAAAAYITVVAANAEAELRAWLSFDLTAPGARIEDAAAIAAQNFRLACAPLCGIVAVRYARGSRPVVDCVLALLLVTNSVLVGAAVAGYGLPLLSVLVPHGPLELAAFSLLGGVYLEGRTDEPHLPSAVAAAALAAWLLVLAAMCEAGLGPS